MSCVRPHRSRSKSPAVLFPAAALAVLAALAAGGCASSSRLSMSPQKPPTPDSRSGLGKPAQYADPAIQRSTLMPPRDYQWNGSQTRMSEGAARAAAVPYAASSHPHHPSAHAAHAPPARPLDHPRRPLDHGSIEVQPGDTLYGLSRRHGVSISALMETNRLKSLTLVPGQVLRLPASSRPRA